MGEEYEYLGQWEKKKVLSMHTYSTAGRVYGVGGTWPAALLLGQLACLLARTEVRARMGKADPTPAPQGCRRPGSGDVFTTLDPAAEQAVI